MFRCDRSEGYRRAWSKNSAARSGIEIVLELAIDRADAWRLPHPASPISSMRRGEAQSFADHAVTYICYVQSLTSSVPHMEPLDASTMSEAQDLAWRMMLERKHAFAAHVFRGSDLVLTLNGKLPGEHGWSRP
jgi:hypothetical protein